MTGSLAGVSMPLSFCRSCSVGLWLPELRASETMALLQPTYGSAACQQQVDSCFSVQSLSYCHFLNCSVIMRQSHNLQSLTLNTGTLESFLMTSLLPLTSVAHC